MRYTTIMARQPFNVHVIPYRESDLGWEFVVMKRADSEVWQGVSGGGEEGEQPEDTALRELREECGVTEVLKLVRLDSVAAIPVIHYQVEHWPEDLYVIPQYAFGAKVESDKIQLSHEHLQFEWLPYEEAVKRLTWHNNRSELWELHQRLKGKGPRG